MEIRRMHELVEQTTQVLQQEWLRGFVASARGCVGGGMGRGGWRLGVGVL